MPEQVCAVMSWSGGKDSALALHYMLERQITIKCLMTTVNTPSQRVAIHGVRKALLEEQSEKLGLPIIPIAIPEMPNNQTYEGVMNTHLSKLSAEGVSHMIYGDIFLEDLKAYRENQLVKHHIGAIFPLWKKDPLTLMHEFLDLGFKAIVVSAQDSLYEFCGRVIDHEFLKDVPKGIDPCGENGEFHTFVFDGPIFRSPVNFRLGDLSHRKFPSPLSDAREIGFWYADLTP